MCIVPEKRKELTTEGGLDLNKNYKYLAKKIPMLLNNNIECRPIVAGNFTKNPVIKYLDHRISGNLNNSDIILKDPYHIKNKKEQVPFL